MFYFMAIFFVTHLGASFRKIDLSTRGLIADIESVQDSLMGSREAPEWLKNKILQFELAGECYLKDLQNWERLFQRELFLRRDTATSALIHWSHLVLVYALLDSLGKIAGYGSIVVSALFYVFLLILVYRMGATQISDEFSRHGGIKGLKLFEIEKRLVHKHGLYLNWVRTAGTLCEMFILGLGVKEFWSQYHEVVL